MADDKLNVTQNIILVLSNKLENIVGKGENSGNQHFHLFPPCIPPLLEQNFNFLLTFILSSASTFSLDHLNMFFFFSFGKDLDVYGQECVGYCQSLVHLSVSNFMFSTEKILHNQDTLMRCVMWRFQTPFSKVKVTAGDREDQM